MHVVFDGQSLARIYFHCSYHKFIFQWSFESTEGVLHRHVTGSDGLEIQSK